MTSTPARRQRLFAREANAFVRAEQTKPKGLGQALRQTTFELASQSLPMPKGMVGLRGNFGHCHSLSENQPLLKMSQ